MRRRTSTIFTTGSLAHLARGGLGPGGNAIYALDITDPTQFSESNATTVVLGEWGRPATITARRTMPTAATSGQHLRVPVMRRLHNGNWGVIFGNGFGSATGDAGIFVMVCQTAAR